MKKFLSMLLAVVLVLSLGTVAFADSYEEYLDEGPTVSKTYVRNGKAPTETFTYKFEAVSYKDTKGNVKNDATTLNAIPAISDVSITFDSDTTYTNNTQTVNATVDADAYALGVYTYKVTEVVPTTKTAGVSYTDKPMYLVLTILRDENNGKHYVAAMHYETVSGEKTKGFENAYESGSLKVSKTITGNMADMNKKFKFTITFAAAIGTEIKSVISSDSTAGTWNGLTYTIELGNGDSVTLSNIPAGTTYTVSENNEDYTITKEEYSDTTKTISANDVDTVAFNNDKTTGVDTGITLDSMPYVVMLVVVCAGLFVVLAKKRAAREN